MDDTTRAQLTAAVKSNEPVAALAQIAREMKAAGKSQREVYDIFVELLELVQIDGVEQEDNAVRDVLDFIVGWCSPSAHIFDTYLET